MKIKRRTWWTIGVAIAAGVLAIVLLLIAANILVLPSSSPATVNVNSIQFTIIQGTNASGNPWFGPSHFNYSGVYNSYPFQVATGGSFSIPVELENYDSMPHTLYSVEIAAPFTLISTDPNLPQVIQKNTDETTLFVDIKAPGSAGTDVVYMTIDTLPPS
jgi:hypothetical protein